MSSTDNIIMFSGGIGSWMTAKRVISEVGKENVTLLFSDVQGKHVRNPHLGEDGDTYRFIYETVIAFDCRFESVSDSRSIWEIYRDDRFLGNARLANCSKFLKQRPAHAFLAEYCSPDSTTVHIGIDWTETHRIPAIEEAYAPFPTRCPLTEPPYLDKDAMMAACREDGIEPPRLYAKGFPHNNCGGFCVRSGHAQFKRLLETDRERYLYHEQKEQELRVYLGKPVSIMKDRRNKTSKPMTMKQFRARVEHGEEIDEDDFGGCGCFVD